MYIYIYVCVFVHCESFNTLRSRQDGGHFPDDVFKCIFLNENAWISIKISLRFVPKGPINNIPALIQIMAWRRSGDKPLSEPMMVKLPTRICVTRPQWVKQHSRSAGCGDFRQVQCYHIEYSKKSLVRLEQSPPNVKLQYWPDLIHPYIRYSTTLFFYHPFILSFIRPRWNISLSPKSHEIKFSRN